MPLRVALIHATAVAMEPIEREFDEQWPAADCVNILDDSLSRDRAGTDDIPPALAERILRLAQYGVETEADAVLFTCSAFGPAIERANAMLPIPVLKPNEAMFDDSLVHGPRIGMVATFPPAVATMEAEFRTKARMLGKDARLEVAIAEGALDSLRAGDVERHDALVVEAARTLGHCDAIMLAQFSMARARAMVADKVKLPVLSSPASAVRRVRALIQASGQAPQPC